MRRTARDDAVRAAFDRFHRSTKPRPDADKQIRRDLTSAGVKPEFEEEK